MRHQDQLDWLNQQNDIENVFACIGDLYGTLRSKRVDVDQARKILEGSMRMPLSLAGVDNQRLLDETKLREHVNFDLYKGGLIDYSGGHGVTGLHTFGRILSEAIVGDLTRFDVFTGLPWYPFPGSRTLRVPYSVMGSWWYGLRDRLGV